MYIILYKYIMYSIIIANKTNEMFHIIVNDIRLLILSYDNSNKGIIIFIFITTVVM